MKTKRGYWHYWLFEVWREQDIERRVYFKWEYGKWDL